jgi:hypothetical protein
MYSQSQLLSMNQDTKYASSSWIKNINNLDSSKSYTLYATNNASISTGRQYIALPANHKLTNSDYILLIIL